MTRKSRWVGILALILIPASASALGLGDIKLNSYLNERLDAEISISVSGQEELSSLSVEVAPRAVFERFGIERLDMLGDLSFTVEPQTGAAAIVRVRSSRPVVEPFLTFLIEAKSSGGRLLREYTVLLDPPLFLPEPEMPEPAPAAPIQPAPSSGVIGRPEVERAPSAAPRPPAAAPTTYGPVRRNETLWGIAEQVRPDDSVSMNQVMMSLFMANPDAFDGNINRLRAGARLQVPDYAGMTRMGRAEASGEVRRHNTQWRAGRAPRAEAVTAAPREEPDTSRLELVPPAQQPEAQPGAAAGRPGAVSAETAAEQEALNEELLAAVRSLRQELEETRSLIGIKDGEIAALQERLAQLEAQGVAPVEEAPPPLPEEEAPAVAVEEPPAEVPAVEPEAPAEPVAEEPVAAPEPSPTPPPARLEDEPGIFSSVWTWLIIVLAALLAAGVAWKRRQEAEGADEYESWASAAQPEPAVEPAPVAAGATAAAAPGVLVEELAEPSAEPSRIEPTPEPEPAPVVEEAGVKAGPAEEAAAESGEYAYPFEDTITGATGINLEQTDTLAEADFHMAYGLYDQAADLIQKAVDREPDRVDLRMKLLDILFVWGQEGEFLEAAKTLQPLLGEAGASDWDRVAIMGRQLCPDGTLFGGAAGKDLAAEAGAAAAVDFDLSEETPEAGEPESIDFDLSTTGEIEGIQAAETQEVTPGAEATAELEIEELGLDVELPEAQEEAKAPESFDETGYTRELERSGGEDDKTGYTRELEHPVGGDDETGYTRELEHPAGSDDETGYTRELVHPEVAGEAEAEKSLEPLEALDDQEDEMTAVLERLDTGAEDAGEEFDADTKTMEIPALKAGEDMDSDKTAQLKSLDADLDLEDLTKTMVDDLEKTGEIPVAGQGPDGETLIEEIFGETEETKIAPVGGFTDEAGDDEPTRQMPEVGPSDVTLSEVGTKLDLARAYMDMGDPDGARSILEEVVSEGDKKQKDEARQLLDGLG